MSVLIKAEKAIEEKNYVKALREAEKAIYQLAYEESKHNQSKAAGKLGVSRGTFRARLVPYIFCNE